MLWHLTQRHGTLKERLGAQMLSKSHAIAFLTLLLSLGTASHAEYEFRKIVESSVPMPGSESQFVSFSHGALAADGSVYFNGSNCDHTPSIYLPCSVIGLYRWRAGELEKVYDNSSPAPNTDTNFEDFGRMFWAAGRLAFAAELESGGGGIFLQETNQGRLIATGSYSFNPRPNADFGTISDLDLTARHFGLVAEPPGPSILGLSLYLVHPDHFELAVEGDPSGYGFEPIELSIIDDRVFIRGFPSSSTYVHDLTNGTTSRAFGSGDVLSGSNERLYGSTLPAGDSHGTFFIASISTGVPPAYVATGVFELTDHGLRTLVRSDGSPPGGGTFGPFGLPFLAAAGQWVLLTGDRSTPSVIYLGSRDGLVRLVGEADLRDGPPADVIQPLDFDGRRLLLKVIFGSGDEALYLGQETELLEVPALSLPGLVFFACLLAAFGVVICRGGLFG